MDNMNRPFNLEKFMIDIGPENGSTLYQENLREYTQREIEELVGHVRKTAMHPSAYTLQSIKKGRLRADAIRSLFRKKIIRSQDVTKYTYELYHKGQKWERVPDEDRAKIEGLLWNEICDVS